jgi:DNA helicase-2/ATP-dependent DNA helicase PcrA
LFNPRPGQKEVLEYVCGKMGISAVPGSGKTHTLSMLAAKLVSSETLAEDQEILIVTLVNSAVDNFSARVAGFLRDYGLMPGVGYRVRTLHGLAYDIVREHPDLAGVDNRFSIADERTSSEILNICVSGWVRTHPEFLQAYSDPDYPPEKIIYKWNEFLKSLSANFINQAKDYQITPEVLHKALSRSESSNMLLDLGYSIYTDYQHALANRGAVDFEDLIRLSYKVLANNPEYLLRLRYRWPFILEDEAQDSSLIQEKLIRLLCGDKGNWVRVGDPNQAIFETFTTADPRLLKDYIIEPDVVKIDLEHSGRSTQSIMDLANYLIKWTNDSHPVQELRDTLSPPFIQPTPCDDLQQNPLDEPGEIYLNAKPLKPADEIRVVAKSVKKWVCEHPDSTIAVLVPRNVRGVELAEELTTLGVPIKEMLNSSQTTRDTAKIIGEILTYFVHPSSHRHLIDAFLSVLTVNPAWPNPPKQLIQMILKQIQNLPVEEILADPEKTMGRWTISMIDETQLGSIISSIKKISRWQRTVLLPIDQMIMTIGMELFSEPSDLALVHKLAVILKSAGDLYPLWELPDFCEELNLIVKNRFRLYGFSEDDLGFDPENYKGRVVISTIHKAKGLEWDRVYLMSVNNYDFPSLQDYDHYMSEKWFVRQNLNLEAEALSLLEAVTSNDFIGLKKDEGIATLEARQGYCAERLRLLYVGITRAKKQLVITWNTGRHDDCGEAVPLQALRSWLEMKHASG